jgi:hypothetical protein
MLLQPCAPLLAVSGVVFFVLFIGIGHVGKLFLHLEYLQNQTIIFENNSTTLYFELFIMDVRENMLLYLGRVSWTFLQEEIKRPDSSLSSPHRLSLCGKPQEIEA